MVIKRWHVISGLVNKHNWTNGAEIGVKEGENLFYILEHCPDLHMIAIDAWEPQPHMTGEFAETYETWPMDKFYDNVCLRRDLDFPDRLDVHRMYSDKACELVEDASLDFVFIDANHTKEGVLNDIKHWECKVKEGGYIMGHDWQFKSVLSAVTEAYPDHEKLENYVWAHHV